MFEPPGAGTCLEGAQNQGSRSWSAHLPGGSTELGITRLERAPARRERRTRDQEPLTMGLRSRLQVLPNEALPMLLGRQEDHSDGMGILSPRGERTLLGPHESFSRTYFHFPCSRPPSSLQSGPL